MLAAEAALITLPETLNAKGLTKPYGKVELQTYSQCCWEAKLPETLHAERSLLCTATNTTPRERFLGFKRRSMLGMALPSQLIQPGPVLLPRFIRNKIDPLMEKVEPLEANQSFAHARFPNGRKSLVSTSVLAPPPRKNVAEVIAETVPIQRTTQPASVSTPQTTHPASVSTSPTTQPAFPQNSSDNS